MIFSAVALALALIAALNCNYLQVTTTTTSYRAAVYDDLGNVSHIDRDISHDVTSYGLKYECREDVGLFEFRLPSAPLTDSEEDEYPFNPFIDPDFT